MPSFTLVSSWVLVRFTSCVSRGTCGQHVSHPKPHCGDPRSFPNPDSDASSQARVSLPYRRSFLRVWLEQKQLTHASGLLIAPLPLCRVIKFIGGETKTKTTN